MTIAKPGRRLMRDVPLPFVRRSVHGGGKRPVTASLSLTSMIDFLVVTVVFLLLTFSPSEALEKSVTVPSAGGALDMIDAPMVTIVGSQILVDGSASGDTRSIEEQKRLERLDALFNILKAKREIWKQLHPNKEFPGAVVLQIDQDVPTIVVKSVFQTAAHAGYPNISFMVQHEAQHASAP